jgi:hypothetical protein
VQQKKADDARPSRSMGATARVSRPVSDDCRELKGTMSAMSGVGDLEGGYIKESLTWDEKGSVRLLRGGNVMSCVTA